MITTSATLQNYYKKKTGPHSRHKLLRASFCFFCSARIRWLEIRWRRTSFAQVVIFCHQLLDLGSQGGIGGGGGHCPSLSLCTAINKMAFLVYFGWSIIVKLCEIKAFAAYILDEVLSLNSVRNKGPFGYILDDVL